MAGCTEHVVRAVAPALLYQPEGRAMRCTHLRQPPFVSAAVAFTLLLLAHLLPPLRSPPPSPGCAIDPTAGAANGIKTSRRPPASLRNSARRAADNSKRPLNRPTRKSGCVRGSFFISFARSTCGGRASWTAGCNRHLYRTWWRRLVEQSGNHVRIGDLTAASTIERFLNFAAGSFWEVLDEACRQSNNRVRCSLRHARAGLFAYCRTGQHGPDARMQDRFGRKSRGWCEPSPIGWTSATTVRSGLHSFELDVQMMWEDRFAGRIPTQSGSGRGDHFDGRATHAGARHPWQLAVRQREHEATPVAHQLVAAPGRGAKLDRLTLRWSLMAVGEMKQLVVDELAESHHASPDGVELTIDSVRSPRPGPI